MPAGKRLYRVLRDDEDPSKGLTARNPEATDAKVSSHVNGLKKSPFISTTASKQAIEAFYWLAIKRYKKSNKSKTEKKFTVVQIDKEKLLEENKNVEVIDLSDDTVRKKYLSGKVLNYARKYEEVLVKGFVPAKYVKVLDVEAMSDSESVSEGFDESDYTMDDIESLSEGTAGITLD
ncbi:uncharacterized protein LOC128546192 [Mercenaria mercenaria]|uniref:uncharacterized protein LOC128546192 n=1 Tax=Mercenaria mercenaria TaxID=6596 RepID=UPI00234E7C23|nr:uncharacterized protein LOC128546192 [Mercenaria mercenaria]XP_053399853.1 uncharacterized protein LOC128546192 [Mercenaria mercenaria]XP_053399854.1 uncharacterized protein LOC128546192 [Mercenaria mercenaria]